MPITKTLPDEWYNTPNIHMCTIKDFFNFCKNRDTHQTLVNSTTVNFIVPIIQI